MATSILVVFPKITTVRLIKVVMFLSILFTGSVGAQVTVRALFLGNSYTHRNDLPELVSSFAKSQGHQLIKTTYAPGGYHLQRHLGDSKSLGFIKSKKWDYVVLQEQSQLPSFSNAQVEAEVFPYAKGLVDSIKANDSCTEIAFYMTWGRKNGDSGNCGVWPPVCTYEGMDSLLSLRYRQMASDNKGIVSPVGAVWKYIRKNHKNIELYSSDGSHPSKAGSYLAACCFYTTLFRVDPTQSSYKYSLTDSVSAPIRRAVKHVVYNHLTDWHIGERDVETSFDFEKTGLDSSTLVMNNLTQRGTSYQWMVSDKLVSTEESPVLKFDSNGTFYVTLIAQGCNSVDTANAWVKVGLATNTSQNIEELELNVRNQLIELRLTLGSTGRLRVFDLCGKTLVDLGFQESVQTAIPIREEPFLVILQIETDKQVFQKKLLIRP